MLRNTLDAFWKILVVISIVLSISATHHLNVLIDEWDAQDAAKEYQCEQMGGLYENRNCYVYKSDAVMVISVGTAFKQLEYINTGVNNE